MVFVSIYKWSQKNLKFNIKNEKEKNATYDDQC
jgi:hypothetical protein